MIGQDKVYEVLKELGIGYDYLEHPAAPTIEIALQYCNNMDSTHCKNLFSGIIKETGIIWLFSIVNRIWLSMNLSRG